MVHAEQTEAQGVTAGFNIVESELPSSDAVRAGQPKAAGAAMEAAMCESDNRTAEEWGMSTDHQCSAELS